MLSTFTHLAGLILGVLASHVVAISVTTAAAGPPQASFVTALVARAAPSDFGSEIVTASYLGKNVPFTHHIGVIFTNNINNDEVIEASAPLLAALEKICGDSSICKAILPPLKESTSEEVQTLDTRQDDPVLEDIVMGSCTEEYVQWVIDNMTPGSELMSAITSATDVVADDFRGFVDRPAADAFQRLNLRMDLLPSLYWVRHPFS